MSARKRRRKEVLPSGGAGIHRRGPCRWTDHMRLRKVRPMTEPFPPLPAALRRLVRKRTTQALCEFAQSEEPVAIEAACREWHLTRSLSGRGARREKNAFVHPLPEGEKVLFPYLPPQLEGDLGFGPDGRPNVSYLTHESSATDFMDGVRRCVLEPAYGVTYAQSRPLTAFPRVAAGVDLEHH